MGELGEKTIVGMIPARGGSKRVQNKNILNLGGHPLLAYSICSALESGIFKYVIVSTDSDETAKIAERYGADVQMRPASISGDLATDYEWVSHLIGEWGSSIADYFAILRPTSPFRSVNTIRQAWRKMLEHPLASSLRGVRKCHEHPGKMWRIEDGELVPLMNWPDFGGQASYNSPYQVLPEVYVQTAAMEISRIRNVAVAHNVSGYKIIPFYMPDNSGFDINNYEDILLAQQLIKAGLACLPEVREAK